MIGSCPTQYRAPSFQLYWTPRDASAGGDREEGPAFGFLAACWGQPHGDVPSQQRRHPSRVPQCLGPGAGTGPGVGPGQGMKGHGLERAGQGRCRQVPGGGPEFGARVVASEPSGLECGGLGVVVLLVSETNFSCAGTGYISTCRLHYIVCELGGSVGPSECPRWWLQVHSNLSCRLV